MQHFMNRMRLRAIGMLLLVSIPVSIYAANSEQVVIQCTGNVTLTTPVDYVITASSDALTGTVNIVNTSAALVFRNIRPTDALGYLSHIKIGGVAAANGRNCRFVVYRHGTIVLPYGGQCQPLTVYAALNCGGEAKSDFSIGTAYRALGTWDNAIMSFTLKRGYMVTMANHVDGTGYSHCFIANDADIMVNLPAEMRSSVSFLRIFPWKWPSKKGLAGHNTTAMNYLGCTWFYAWNAETYAYNNFDYVPQRHHETGTTYNGKQTWAWPEWGVIDALTESSHVLGQNEPDNTSGEETYMKVEKLIELHKYFLYGGLRIGTFATCNPNVSWVKDYVNRCRQLNMRVDFVATHYYTGGQSPSSFINSLRELHDATGLPVWVTEWNNGANWTSEKGFTTDSEGWYEWSSDNGANHRKNGIWLADCLKRADDCPWLERLCVYNNVEYKRFVYYEDSFWPTPAGERYRDYQSDFAYVSSNENFMPWNYSAPSGLGGFKQDATISLTWRNPNTDCTKQTYVQRKNGNTWVDVLEAGISDEEARSIVFTDETAGTAPTYRVCNVDADGTRRYTSTITLEAPDENGLARLTAMPDDVGDYYFVFQSAEAQTTLNLSMADGTRQNGYKVAKYAAPADNGIAENQLWQLEGNEKSGFALRNLSNMDYVMTSPNSWNFRIDGNTHLAAERAYYLPEVHTDGGETYWTLKNVYHGTYCGLWDNDKNFYAGAELAGNRTLAETDHLRLYAVKRLTYNEQRVATGETEMNYTLINPNFSWGSTTQSPMGSGSITIPAGWTFQKTFDGWNDVFLRQGDVGGQTATYFNVWAGQLSYAELMQTVNCLPNGVYHISADLATTTGYEADKTWTAVYGAPDKYADIARSVNITGAGDDVFLPYDVYVRVTNNKLTIGVRTDGTWFKVANMRLQYIGMEDEISKEVEDRLNLGRTLQYIFVNREHFLRGDVNGDGQVSVADVTTLVNIILGKAETAPAADVNLDGSISVSDVTSIVNIILHK